MNIAMQNKVIGTLKERCGFCEAITKGVLDYSHPDVYSSIFKDNLEDSANKIARAREILKALAKR